MIDSEGPGQNIIDKLVYSVIIQEVPFTSEDS